MKRRSFFLTLALGVILLLSLSGLSIYWILAQSPLNLLQGGVMAEPVAAVLVPRQAPVMISLLVSPEHLETFSQLIASPANRRRSQVEIEDLETSILAKTGLNYEQEIQPWLGDEITLAVTTLDLDRNAENGTQPGYLLAVKTKDEELAKEFLGQSYSKQAIAVNTDLVFEQYKGINIISQTGNVGLGASAVVGDFVLFANEPKVLRDAINNIQTGENLKNAPYYQDALRTIEEPRIGIVYANIPTLSAWLARTNVPENPEVSQMLTVALSLKSSGLVAQNALIGVAGTNQAPILNQPVGALDYIPEDSIITAASTNLAQFWTQVEDGLAENSPLQQLSKQLVSRLEKPLGLDLPADIFSWVQGEYSLALIPHEDGKQPDWLFVVEKTPGVAEAIARLDELAQQQGYSVGNLPLFETTVTAWTKLATATAKSPKNLARLTAQVRGVHTTQGKYEILATSVEAIAQALTAKDNSLVNSDKFQRAIAAIPTNNDGYFYIDWRQSEPLINEKLPILRVLELAGQPLFKNLRSLTISSQGSTQEIRRATLYFNLGS